MGFLSNLWKKTKETVGKVLEAVGRVTRIEPLEQAGRNLRIQSNPAEKKVDMTKQETYQARDVIDLHSRCEQVRKEAVVLSHVLEQRCIENIDNDVRQYRKKLERLFSEDAFRSFDYEVGDDFVKDISATISSHVSKRISQDNPEFLKILRQDDHVRIQNSQNYIDKVMQEAWNLLSRKCYSRKAELFRRMHMAINEYLNRQSELVRDYEQKLVQLQAESKNAAAQKENVISALAEAEHIRCIHALTR